MEDKATERRTAHRVRKLAWPATNAEVGATTRQSAPAKVMVDKKGRTRGVTPRAKATIGAGEENNTGRILGKEKGTGLIKREGPRQRERQKGNARTSVCGGLG